MAEQPQEVEEGKNKKGKEKKETTPRSVLYVVKECAAALAKGSDAVSTQGNYWIRKIISKADQKTPVDAVISDLMPFQEGNPRQLLFRCWEIPSERVADVNLEEKGADLMQRSAGKVDRLDVPGEWWFRLKDIPENEFVADIQKTFGCTLSNPWLPCRL